MTTPAPGRGPAVRLLRKPTGPGITPETEVAFDEIVSDAASKGNFVMPVARKKEMTSSHLAGPKPNGGNVLACDGHVRWREFSQTTGVAVASPDGLARQWVPQGPAYEPIGTDVP